MIRNIEAALAKQARRWPTWCACTTCCPPEAIRACWPVLREAFGKMRPAATMMVVGLLDPAMKIEIEVTARRRASPAA